MITYEWTIATWANRAASATTYVAIDKPIDGAFIDRYGYLSTTAGATSRIQRNPYKVDEADSIVYKTYQSGDGIVPIIRITEV